MKDNKTEKELVVFSSEDVGYAMKETCKRAKEKLEEMDAKPEEFRKFVIDWITYRETR